MASHILLIAPYGRLAQTARRVLGQMGLEIPVETASDQRALRALEAHPDARIVISRGGTLKFLSGRRELAFVDIGTSPYDLLAAIGALGAEGCRRIAVVTQENIIGFKEGAFELPGVEVRLLPCQSAEDIIAGVDRCLDGGYDGIAGCMIAVKTARARGARHAFIHSDSLTVKRAVLQALEIERGLAAELLDLRRLGSLIDSIAEGAVIFDEGGLPVFYNAGASRILGGRPREAWHDLLEGCLAPPYSHPRVLDLDGRPVLVRVRAVNAGTRGNTIVLLTESAALEQQTLSLKSALSSRGLYAKKSFPDILYKSPAMAECVELAAKFAASDSTVMIFGETGVGKEGFAQSIHNASRRSRGPFVSVNCSSLPQGLVASELFGYVEGAFTGARRSGKKGLFELAQGGTIFLDEITELPLDVQSQILRVIQEREVMRVGGDKVIPLDIRVICAANRKILPLCRAGRFRYDLYYRINVLNLTIPPLRDRPEDIVYLFLRFAAEFLSLPDEEIVLDEGAAELLAGYSWPGNVRELKNTAEAMSFYGPRLRRERLERLLSPEPDAAEGIVLPGGLRFKDLERVYLTRLLSAHSLSEAARISGIPRTTLWRRLRELERAGADGDPGGRV